MKATPDDEKHEPAEPASKEKGSGGEEFDLLDATDDHAAERLREFIDQRFPEGIESSPLPEIAEEVKSPPSPNCTETEEMAGATTDAHHTCEEKDGQGGSDDDECNDGPRDEKQT
jgi:hypothetical protein